MFFYLSKIITFLIDPLFIILVLLLFFLLKGKKRISTRLILYPVFSLLYLASTGSFSDSLLYQLEQIEKPSRLLDRYDAVIVLSGMTDARNSGVDRIEFSGAVDRILAGIRLVKQGRAEYLVISGGDGSLAQKNKPEARVLRDFSLQWGLKQEQILIDDTSRNTYQNAVLTAKLLQNRKMKKLLLVTSAFHMFRARGCFTKAGLDVDVYPVDYRAAYEEKDFRRFLPSSFSLAKTNLVIHELLGIFVYSVTGRADYGLF